MARLIYSEQALKDFERLAEFLLEVDESAALETSELIINAVDMLSDHPLVGRIVDSDICELVISRGRTGYVALYHYDSVFDVVVILTIRHQREAGYPQSDTEI